MKSRRIAILGAVCTVLVGIAAYGITRWNNRETSSTSGVQFRIAPNFELQDASGKSHRLSDLRGNVVLLHFWASWCPPCLSEIGQWVGVANEFKGKPLKLVAISLDNNWKAALKVLPSSRLPAGVLSLLDPKTKVSDRYGSYAFPETYLIDPHGKIITKWVGPQQWTSPNFTQLMNELLTKVQKQKN